MHQGRAGTQGQITDIKIAAKEFERLDELVAKILSKHTGQSLDKIRQDTDRDIYFNAEQAVEYGLVDDILSPAQKKEKK
jgi:ATP-dependent Clp protease protease subunit